VATILERRLKDGSKKFLVQVRRRGAKPQSQTFTRKTDATRWAKSMESAIDEGRAFPHSTARRTTLVDTIDRFLKGEGKRWPNDRRRYLERWSEALGHLTLAQVTRSEIVKERDRLAAEGMAPATVNRMLAYLSRVLSVAVTDYELIGANPMLRAKLKLEEPQHRVRFLSPVELAALREACAKSEQRDLALFVEAAMHTGARAGELAGLRWTDCDLETGVAVLNKTKSKKRRTIPLRGRLLDALRTKPRLCPLLFHSNGRANKDGEMVYGLIQYDNFFRAALAEAKITNLRFHDLRHHAASMLVQNGVGIYEVGNLLGHSSIEVTKRYAHLAPDAITQLGDRLAEVLR
jgi:integrase